MVTILGLVAFGSCQSTQKDRHDQTNESPNHAAETLDKLDVSPDTKDPDLRGKYRRVAGVIWDEPGAGTRWIISFLAGFWDDTQNFCGYVEGKPASKEELGRGFNAGLDVYLAKIAKRTRSELKVLTGTRDNQYPDRLYNLSINTRSWEASPLYSAFGLAACIRDL